MTKDEMTAKFREAGAWVPGRHAFLAGNEPSAKFIVAAAKHLNLRMPDDFAMVSFDDFDLAESMETPLTVMRQPVESIGETAANLLFRRMMNEGNDARLDQLEKTLRAELVVRQSSSAATVGG